MKTALKFIFVGVLLTAASARASQSGTWIINGASLEYAGAATGDNKLRIGYGTVWAYDGGSGAPGQNYQVTETTVTTSPVAGMLWASATPGTCPASSTTSLQGDSTAY